MTVGIDKYPYYTNVISTFFDGDESPNNVKTKVRSGFIISEDYVLTHFDPYLDAEVSSNYTIEVLADASKYEATLVRGQKFVLFKLDGTIQSDSLAHRIQLLDADKSPKPGDQVNIVDLQYNKINSTYGIMSINNVTLKDGQEDCIRIHSGAFGSSDDCKDSVFLESFDIPCKDSVISKSLVIQGQLAGLYETTMYLKDGREVASYLNLAHLNDKIKELIGELKLYRGD
ncbi:hypothetical protein QAD02_018323 [Eretmocerus hayati]|uniref:Uncharacterized protein n=1 Tax=Eretmocerus hayati TaxID=131215 RepID=A0ACC2PHM1_9HYME|nr:hypothetical protein QAD02_018323 [Eretmocerus hayati]